MITSIQSHGDEPQVNGAFANIGLIANKVWAHDQEDKYRKLNQSLWLQNCKLSETYNGIKGRATRVRDVIPDSRLAQYGNYEYNEEREKMYNSVGIERGTWTDEEVDDKDDRREEITSLLKEPWMHKQVEEYFFRLASPSIAAFPSPGISHRFPEDENGKYPMTPYSIEDNSELQLQSRITAKSVKDLWNTRRSGDSLNRAQKSLTPNFYVSRLFNDEAAMQEEKVAKMRRYGIEKRSEIRKNFQQTSYSLRNDRNSSVKRTPSILYPVPTTSPVQNRPIVPVLCPEVAEFFPKGPTSTVNDEDRQGSIQFFPSSAEPSYKDELFPYNQAHLSHSSTFTHNPSGLAIAVSHPTTVNTWIRAPAHQWIHRIGPPIHIQVPGVSGINNPPIYSAIQPFCPTIVHRPININEKLFAPGQSVNTAPIPVYQRPAELYQEGSQRRGKSNQGVDFNNLILLTKNAMKARRNQSKNPQQASSFILESRQPNLKSESDVLQWLNKGYPKRAREFGTVNSLVSELTRFEGKCDCTSRTMATSTTTIGQFYDLKTTPEPTTPNDSIEEVVLGHSHSHVPIMMAKKRLYRDVLTNTASTDIIVETLLDKRYDELEQQAMEQYRTSEECLAIRYQELERQGLEQYRYNDSSSESIKAICSSTFCAGKRLNDEMTTERDDEERCGTVGNNGIRCSGFEKHRCCNISPGEQDICPSDADKAGAPMERALTILRSHIKCASVNSTIGHQGSFGSSRNNSTKETNAGTKSLTALDRASFEIGSAETPSKGASGDKIEEQVESSMNKRHLIVLSDLEKTMPPMSNDIISKKPSTGVYCKDSKISNPGIPSGGGDEKVKILRSSPTAQVWLSSFWR